MTPPPAVAVPAPAVRPRSRPRPLPDIRTRPAPPRRRPRRVSGPTSRSRTVSPAAGLTARPLLDRLIRGRIWIAVVAFALIGIVTMQLGLLKLNAGIGRALEHEAALQRENSALSIEDSEVAAGDTVELQAAHLGMQLIPTGTLKFLSAQPSAGETARAVAALNARASASSTTGSSSQAESSEATPASAEASSATAAEGEAGSEGSSSAQAGAPEAGAEASSASTAGAAGEGESQSAEGAAGESSPAASESAAASAGPQG